MLQISLGNGESVQRVFAGFIASEDDLAKFIEELKQEFHSRRMREKSPILCEMWEYTLPIIGRRKLPTKKEELHATTQ